MSWIVRLLILVVVIDVVGLVAAVAPWAQIGGLSTRFRPLLVFGLSLAFALCALAVMRLRPRTQPTLPGPFLPATVYAFTSMSAVVGVGGVLSLALSLGASPLGTHRDQRPRERSAVLLTINDVYRIEGLRRGAVGGLARVRTLRKELEGTAPGRVLLLHAGDVIFPSLLSRLYEGKQMIDVLNLLDGDATPGRMDERMFVVFGNHEFENEDCRKPSPLADRVGASDFFWLHSNIALTPCKDGRPRLTAANVLHGRIVDVGGVRIGLFGLTIKSKHPSFTFLDALETAEAMTLDLRRRGAEVVVAVTHLPWEDDLQIYRALRARGLDLIVGGHDHENMKLPDGVQEPRIFKADADAATAWVLTLHLRDGVLRVEHDLQHLNRGVRRDPEVAERVTTWLERHERAFCNGAGLPPGCLGEVLGTTTTELGASEEKIRKAETSLGNWITDRMLDAFKTCGADAAIINAGGLRLNQDLAPGSITRRDVEELVQYKSDLYLLELTGQQLAEAMKNAISQPGAGRWPQVSGLAFVYDSETRTVDRLVVRPTPTRAAVDALKNPAHKFRVVVNAFLTENTDEGYTTILPIAQAIPCGVPPPPELKQVVYDALKAQPAIAPVVEGRICKTAEAATRSCQAVTWLKGRTR